MSRMIKCVLLAILAVASIPIVAAQGQSTFTTGQRRHDVLFAVTVPHASTSPDDLYFYISGPSDSSWIGLGFGERMKDALMLIVYQGAKNKSEATISPRISHGHSEPTYGLDIVIDKVKSSIHNGRYSVQGMCQNCRKLKDKYYIDFDSTEQPMIYALGPDRADLSSNNKAAGLRRHERYGRFTFNMTQAVSGTLDPDADFPREGDKSNNGAVAIGHEEDDHEYSSYTHGLLMIAVFVLLFPLGAIWLRIFEKVRWHWINQVFGVVVIFVAAAIGINLSRQYNRSKTYEAPHQIIGFTLLALVLIQIGLGATHHRIFQRQQRRTILSLLHRTLGPAILILGILNGALGFRFASTPRHIIGYIILIIILSLLYLGATFLHDRRRRRKAVYQTPAAINFQSAYVPPEHQFDIPLGRQGAGMGMGGGGGGGQQEQGSGAAAPPPYSRIGG